MDTGTEPVVDAKAVIETRLTHEVHRNASGLLTEAADRSSVPLGALAQLRDFLVANLRHHHETEDHDLWPRLIAAQPALSAALEDLSAEHARLDAALDALAGVRVEDDDDRPGLREAASVVRDVVHAHLANEEPHLLPALREHISAEEWKDFAEQVIATTPPVAGHLMVGFLDRVGTPEEVELVLSGLPEPVRPLVPAMRSQAAHDLGVLEGAAR